MSEEESYLTVAEPAQIEYRARDSRFYAHIFPLPEESRVDALLVEMRAAYPDATHYCYAFRIGAGDQCTYRADDAGEPAGSAGRPILQALETRNVSDVLLVVVRYFGGTKLGIGGLIRAYGGAAFAVLDAARLVPVVPKEEITIRFAYPNTGAVHQILSQQQAEVLDSSFGEEVSMRVAVEKRRSETLKRLLQNATRGKIQFL